MPPLVMSPTKYLMWAKLPELRSGKVFLFFVSICYCACLVTDGNGSENIGS